MLKSVTFICRLPVVSDCRFLFQDKKEKQNGISYGEIKTLAKEEKRAGQNARNGGVKKITAPKGGYGKRDEYVLLKQQW